jgi:hypothetical protein
MRRPAGCPAVEGEIFTAEIAENAGFPIADFGCQSIVQFCQIGNRQLEIENIRKAPVASLPLPLDVPVSRNAHVNYVCRTSAADAP